MRIETILEKGVGAVNEDAVLVSKRRFGVFDGVTSIDRYVDTVGKTGGYRASHAALEVFERSARGLREAALEANDTIESAMEKEKVDSTSAKKRWGTTLAVVDVDVAGREFEWVQVADSFIVVIGKDGVSRTVNKRGFPDTEILMAWKELGEKKMPDILSHVRERLIELRATANVRYGILNGDPSVEKFLSGGKESLEGVAHIVIFTDGFIIPRKDPSAPDDFSEMASLFLSGGLSAVRDRIRQIEETDPNCWEYPRYKKSDDIGAVAISFV